MMIASPVCRASGPAETVRFAESDIDRRLSIDGVDYVLVDGEVYRDTGGGDYRWMLRYYDPDFLEENYLFDDGDVYRIAEIDGASALVRLSNSCSDDFESYGRFLDTMMTQAGPVVEIRGGRAVYDYRRLASRWGSLTLQSPEAPEVKDYVELRRSIIERGGGFLDNRVDLSRETAHSGTQSLRFYALPPDRSMVTSKASISTESVFFRKGDEFRFSGWFFFAQGIPTTIMDLESTWLDQRSGIRILFSRSGSPYIELKAFDKPMLKNTGYRVPENRWVRIEARILLDDVDGLVDLRIDGEQVIRGSMPTLPLADTVLDSVEIGITATAMETILYVDDVEISGGDY